MKRIIEQNRNLYKFENGMTLPDGQKYSGHIDKETNEKSGYGI